MADKKNSDDVEPQDRSEPEIYLDEDVVYRFKDPKKS